MAQVDQPPRMSGRVVAMILSPLPQHQRKRKFHLFHGELIEEDDHDDEEEELDDEVPDDEGEGETPDGASEGDPPTNGVK